MHVLAVDDELGPASEVAWVLKRVFSVKGIAGRRILSAERQVYGTPAAPSAGMLVGR